jgi:hypothetical protein
MYLITEEDLMERGDDDAAGVVMAGETDQETNT